MGLGIRPWLAPFRPNGKPLHVHGFLGAFERVAAATPRGSAGSPRPACPSSASIRR